MTALKTFVVGNPWKNWIFLKVYTDEGIEGLGEATSGLNTRPVQAALEELAPLCLGEDPTQIGAVMDKLNKALFLPQDAVITHALSAVNLALWDILGKSLQAPLYRLLGGKCRPALRAYANGWYQGPRDPVFFAQEAAKVVEMGYTALKFDPFGTAYLQMDREEERRSVAIVRAVREAVGEDVELMIEAHDRFSVPQALRLGRLLEEFSPAWLETPVLSTDIAATSYVASHIPVPVASGERFASLSQFAELLASRAVSFIQPETLRVGGISGMLSAVGLAKGFGAFVCPHNAQSPFTTAVNAHLGVALPEIYIQECFDHYQVQWAGRVLENCPAVQNRLLAPTELPGIGVTLNEAEAEKYPYGAGNFLRLFCPGWETRRMDGKGEEK